MLGSLAGPGSVIERVGNGNLPYVFQNDVTITLTYSGNCEGLTLHYDTGDQTGQGVGVGRVFPLGSPASIKIIGAANGGTEKWLKGTFTLTASTTSSIAVQAVTTTINVK